MARLTENIFRAGLFCFLWQVSTGLVFEDNKVYTYSYEVDLQTGISDAKIRQYAVRKFNATLVIQKTVGKAFFQLSDVQSDAYNLRNGKSRFHESFAKRHFIANFGSWKSDLQQPFAVEFNDGMIVAVEFPSKDPDLPPNIQKAIASLFQINLRPLIQEHETAYSQSEAGIGGEFKTMYQVTRLPKSKHKTEATERLKVSKIRLYDEFTQRPSLFYSSLKGYPCPSCGHNEKPLNRLGRTEYRLKKTDDHFIIEQIESTGTITFTAFGASGQTVSSVVRQSLNLLNVEAKTVISPTTTKWQRSTSLVYEFLKSKQENERIDVTKTNFANWIHKQSSPRNLLGSAQNFLIKAARDADSAEGLKQALLLKTILQRFSYGEFNNFFRDPTNFNIPISEVAKTRRNVLVDVLPLVGTYPSINFMLNLIHLASVQPNEAEKMLSSFPLYLKESSVQILEIFWEFLHVIKDRDQNIYNSGWLSFGSVVYKSCVPNAFNPYRTNGAAYVDTQTCERCLEKMVIEYRNAKTEPERMTLLRAIKNTRHPSTLKFFYEILTGKYSIYLRHTALCGISLQINMHSKDEISSMIRPIYLNYEEDDILRIYSFELLLYLYPTSEFFSELVTNFAQEPSQQVASHIYSTLMSFSNSTDPCHEKFTEYAKEALKQIPEPNYDILTHSLNRHFTYYNDKYLFGRSGQFSILGSNSTVFPREIYFRQGFNLLGHNFDVVEYGLINDNPFYLDLLILSLRQNFAMMPGPPKHPKVLKDLRYKQTNPPDKYDFEMYTKIFNQDVLLSNTLEGLKKSIVPESSNDDEDIPTQFTISHLRSYDVTYVIPNELGVPTVLSLEMPVQMGFNGSATFSPRKSSISTDAVISLSFVSHAKISVLFTGSSEDGFLLKSSGTLQLPISGSAVYTKKEDHKHSTQLKYIPPKQTRHRLLHYDSEPTTFVGLTDAATVIEKTASSTEKNYKFGHDYLGFGVRVNLLHEDNLGMDVLKNFFQSSKQQAGYFYLSEKLFAGLNGILDYAVLNPLARNAKLDVFLEQSSTAPTTELTAGLQTTFTSLAVENNRKGLDLTEVAVKVVAKGPKKREWLTGYQADYYWPVKDERNFKFYFKRSAIPHYDSNEFEVCLTSNMSISNYSEVFNDFLKPQPIPVKLRYDARLTFGKSCATSSEQLKVKVLGEKSKQLWFMDRSSLPFYAHCEENIAAGFAFSFPCWLAKKHTGRLDKFTADFQHNNFQANIKDQLFRSYSWLRHMFYDNLEELNLQTGPKRENHIQIVANFSFYEPIVDVIVIRPDQRASYKNIYIPAFIPQYQPFTVAENIIERFTRNAFNYKPPFCIISGSNVRTFDGVVYQYSVNECFHVVFSECAKGEIAVLYRRVEGSTFYTKAVKVLLDQHVVEMMPEGNDSLVVTVDGRRVFEDGSRIHNVVDRNGTLITHVFRDVDGYVVEAEEYDFEFFFNGNDLEFFISAFYKGKHCGLCGNYDGERIHEFAGSDGKQHETVESFTQSYAAKGRENYCN